MLEETRVLLFGWGTQCFIWQSMVLTAAAVGGDASYGSDVATGMMCL
jgi:hypothetical protein